MSSRIPVLACLVLLSAPAAAQSTCGVPGVTATVVPQHAAPGQPVTVTIHNGSAQTIQLPTSCVFQSVHAGSCTGPAVLGLLCLQVITPIAPGASRSMPWDQTDDNGQQVPNGTYGIDIRYYDAAFNAFSCCPTVTIGCGAFVTYGTGCPDSSGRTPSLGGAGCLAAGGNISVTLSGGPAGAPAVLLSGLGRGAIPITPACALEIAPATGIAVPITLSAAGGFAANATLPASTPPGTFTLQLAAIDASAGPLVLTVSNGLELQIP